ncbi:MAG TPA: ABC transporter substrate-binding protein [Candidatus Saccharimonadia bacterium]|nr:ABC transporter substrate-binding protein [Candidatus Saccharimonadia bacterium]
MHVRTVGIMATLILVLIAVSSLSDAQPRGHIPVVGILRPGGPALDSDPKSSSNAFRQGLRELGYVEGQTILLEYRYAEWQWDRLPSLAAELVQLKPDVMVTITTPGALAAKQATTTIPIVVAVAEDLVADGIVASLARPGGNITGQSLRDLELAGKRLELLKEAVPTITQVAVLVHAADRAHDRVPGHIAAEAQALGVRLQRVEVGDAGAFDQALGTVASSGAGALMVMDSAMFNAHRQRILDFALTHRLPTVCGVRPYAEAGCLIAYAPDIREMNRHAAVFVDKILKGAKPGDLPVEQPAKFELVINLKTAQALGLIIPPTLLFQAHEVIR